MKMNFSCVLTAKSGKLLCFIIFVFLQLPFQLKAQTEVEKLWPISKIYSEFPEDSSGNIGKTVTVSGTVTVSTGLFHEQYLQSFIQDETGGIALFSEEVSQAFKTGDSLIVTGQVQQYYGLTEVEVDSYEVFRNAGRSIKPVPLEVAIDNPQAYLGQLVNGKGTIVEKGNIHNGKYLRVGKGDSSVSTILVYVSNFHVQNQDFDFQTPSIGDEIEITGIMGEYDPEFPEERTFHIYLRTPTDLQYVGIPRYYFPRIAAGLFVITLLGIGWVTLLKSRVKDKTEEIQNALEEKEILLREIHHRVKNNLSIVGGLLDLQMDGQQNEEVLSALQDSRSRIQSMALIHEKLYATESFTQIRLDIYLKELAEAIHKTFNSYKDSVNLTFEMENITVSVDQAIPCALLINELMTNAFKHAFTDTNGILKIVLEEDNDKIALKVTDNGPGLPDDVFTGKRNSLGIMLIQNFADQLSAELKIRNENGAHFSFIFPLEE